MSGKQCILIFIKHLAQEIGCHLSLYTRLEDVEREQEILNAWSTRISFHVMEVVDEIVQTTFKWQLICDRRELTHLIFRNPVLRISQVLNQIE